MICERLGHPCPYDICNWEWPSIAHWEAWRKDYLEQLAAIGAFDSFGKVPPPYLARVRRQADDALCCLNLASVVGQQVQRQRKIRFSPGFAASSSAFFIATASSNAKALSTAMASADFSTRESASDRFSHAAAYWRKSSATGIHAWWSSRALRATSALWSFIHSRRAALRASRPRSDQARAACTLPLATAPTISPMSPASSSTAGIVWACGHRLHAWPIKTTCSEGPLNSASLLSERAPAIPSYRPTLSLSRRSNNGKLPWFGSKTGGAIHRRDALTARPKTGRWVCLAGLHAANGSPGGWPWPFLSCASTVETRSLWMPSSPVSSLSRGRNDDRRATGVRRPNHAGAHLCHRRGWQPATSRADDDF
jgi:hypothetical protein